MEASEGSPAASTNGTYVLRDLIKDVPLSSDDQDANDVHITCVDAWNGNLYIGTSAGEVLHYVSIPPDPSDESGQPSYIFATKLQPQYKHKQEGADAGVKQILVLPEAGKACILCHGMLNFYTLPELSPAFGGLVQQGSCSWVGGVSPNAAGGHDNAGGGIVLVICLKQRLRLIRIPTDGRNPNKPPLKVRDIELGGVSALQRRGDLACVADGRTYALLDVVNQRKNDLFPISSLVPLEPDLAPSEPSAGPGINTAPRSTSHSPARQGRSHERSTSHGGQIGRLQADHGSPFPPRSTSRQGDATKGTSTPDGSPAKPHDTSARSSTEVQEQSASSAPAQSPQVEPLPPNIVCPTADEFLLTTGTKLGDPGVGLFVNMDGDPTRGTLEFSSYPESLVLDGSGVSEGQSSLDSHDSEGYVLAIVRRQTAEGQKKVIEIQRWDDEGAQQPKEWLATRQSGSSDENDHYGLRIASTPVQLSIPDISTKLRSRRLLRNPDDKEVSEMDTKRNAEEDSFASRFSQVNASVLFFHQDKVSWITRNALVTQLERRLNLAVRRTNSTSVVIDVPGVQQVINSIRGQEPRNELEFLTLTYIRQKASLLLFGNLLVQTANGFTSYERDKRFADEALIAGDIDPRVILTLVPLLDREVVQGKGGIWIAKGLCDTISMFQSSIPTNEIVQDPEGAYGENILSTVKNYLIIWRKKKGFGSVADEAHVFQTVDAALLHIMLLLDKGSPRGPAMAGSIRAELNDIVDRGVDCFDRAVELFEQFHRLYMLSRLYQQRKMVALVLSTWKRILEGEHDAGGELVDGESDLRRYLSKIRDQNLVLEYGSWLANRNPKLGVEVFADETGRVKFAPSEAVKILNENAPGAVKDYLEHLVFEKNQVQYVNDLIAFYLAIVLRELESSKETKQGLLESYETYRALRPPKPTYGQFVEDNSDGGEWQQSRLRLLQLIGGSQGAASKYDVHALRERLAPYSNELVPEMIILNGREGKHEEALRLLTHGLGDYDTTIRYCLRGGSSIFHPGTSGVPEPPLPSKEEQSALFEHLLHEFFKIEDPEERMERTAELLERFGGWFDISAVLELLPDTWSVDTVAQFLVHSLRRLVQERNETTIAKALSSAQNLRQSVDVIEKVGLIGPTLIMDGGGEVEVE